MKEALLIFKRPLPEEEEGSNTFEVENRFIVLPEGMLIEGVAYSGFTVFKGDYLIEREYGDYGQVYLSIAFVD